MSNIPLTKSKLSKFGRNLNVCQILWLLRWPSSLRDLEVDGERGGEAPPVRTFNLNMLIMHRN